MKETALAVATKVPPHWTDWLQSHLLACPIKEWTHLDCPGCGFQRSFVALLKGELIASWHFYPPGIFLVSTIALLILHLMLDLKYGAAILKILYIASTIAIVANYVYKIVNHQLS